MQRLFVLFLLLGSTEVLAASYQHDRTAPITITADAMRVEHEHATVFFTGHVEAVQGKLHLTANQMQGYYQTEGAKTAPYKVTVEGNVVLTTPTQTAKGDRGIYNMKTGKLELFGHVYLKQEGNTLEGEHLVHDMATGKSTLEGAKTDNNVTTKRVRAVLQPQSAPKP